MILDLSELARKVTEKTLIPTLESDLVIILSSLINSQNFWEVVYRSARPFNQVAETLGFLQKRGLINTDNKSLISLTLEGEKTFAELNIKPLPDYSCSNCSGRGISIEKLKELKEKFAMIVKKRPAAIIDFDQGYVTEETTISRIAHLAQRGDLEGKEIIILGDDDLVSLAAALSGLPKRVVVFEIDTRLTDFIKEQSEKYNLGIETYEHDLKYKLPAEFLNKFDTFLTDPPETVKALVLFIERGLAALKGPGCAGYFGLTMAESSFPKWLEFQSVLAEKFKVVLTEAIPNFNEYVNWDYLHSSIRNDLPFLKAQPNLNWYRSTQFRIITLPESVIKNEDLLDNDIYIDEESLVFTRMKSSNVE